MLNKIGYELLRQDRIKEVIKIFMLLVSEFPDSYNPYDSLGEGYFMNMQYDLALVHYKKSFKLNPDKDNGRQMIEKMKQAQNN